MRNLLTGIPSSKNQPLKPQITGLLPQSIDGKIIKSSTVHFTSLSPIVQEHILHPLKNHSISEDNLCDELKEKINNTEKNIKTLLENEEPSFVIDDGSISEDKLSLELKEKINKEIKSVETKIERIEKIEKVDMKDDSILNHHLSSECITADKIYEGCITGIQIDNNAISTTELCDNCVTESKLSIELLDKINKEIEPTEQIIQRIEVPIEDGSISEIKLSTDLQTLINGLQTTITDLQSKVIFLEEELEKKQNKKNKK
jgi:hypothetical protein